MRMFLDTAHVESIRNAVGLGVIDGVTTNPTLLGREGGDPITTIKTICDIVQGDVSAEVVATDYESMVTEGRRLAALDPHIVVKIPMTPTGVRAIRTLSQESIRVNTTLIFNPLQAILAAKAGAYFVSPFVGRLDDIGHDGIAMVEEIMTIFDHYGFETQVLVASVRNTQHVLRAALIGADVVTLPPKIFDKLFQHPLTDRGLERFLADWKEAGFGSIA